MFNRRFDNFMQQIYCEFCKDWQEWYMIYGHYYCSKCKQLLGFPSGRLWEPHKWNIEATSLIKIPYKHNHRTYNPTLGTQSLV